MTERRQITLPVEYDGDDCGSCTLAFHASYGFICAAFDQLLEKEGKTIKRCPKCKAHFDEQNVKPTLFDNL